MGQDRFDQRVWRIFCPSQSAPICLASGPCLRVPFLGNSGRFVDLITPACSIAWRVLFLRLGAQPSPRAPTWARGFFRRQPASIVTIAVFRRAILALTQF
jgi:hypothetical protein